MTAVALSRIRSEPIPVQWAGWRSTTRELQANGWELSAQQDIFAARLRIAFRLPGRDGQRVLGITEDIGFDHRQDLRHDLRTRPAPLRVQLANDIRLMVPASAHWFAPITAEPEMWDSLKELEDLAHFVPIARGADIVVPEPSVQELLEKILALQDPARNDRFKRLVDEKHQRRVHAQIVSIAA